MKNKKELIEVLTQAGFSPEMIEEHLPKFWRFAVESKARELEFWGNYFVNTGNHYREHHTTYLKNM